VPATARDQRTLVSKAKLLIVEENEPNRTLPAPSAIHSLLETAGRSTGGTRCATREPLPTACDS